jgi:hypothetical protein
MAKRLIRLDSYSSKNLLNKLKFIQWSKLKGFFLGNYFFPSVLFLLHRLPLLILLLLRPGLVPSPAGVRARCLEEAAAVRPVFARRQASPSS